jgi:3-oxoacyl-(acyl-carrier-protein) synthase
MKSSFKDIAITGMGTVSAGGIGTSQLLETVREKRSMLTPVPDDILGEAGHLWGKATAFKSGDFLPPLKARKLDRASLFATVAAGMALKEAGVDLKAVAPERVGIAMGCGFGGISNSEEFLRGYLTKGIEGLVPMLFPNTVPNAAASNASIEHGFRGPNVTQVQRFCSAESALLMACRFMEEDRADIMLAGGADDLSAIMLKGFSSMRQLHSHAEAFGEGSGVIVLERMDHAVRRGARILATIGEIRTIGRLLPGREDEGVEILKSAMPPDIISLSGSAAEMPLLLKGLDGIPRIEIGRLVGRSLAMGGVAITALILSLAEGSRGLHLAASPEGPIFSIDFMGGPPVQP